MLKVDAPQLARFVNPVVKRLLRIGMPLGGTTLLTVRGRRSGVPRQTAVTLTPEDDGWILISPYGEADWVKNLRAAGTATVTRRRRDIPVTATELPPDEAAPRLRQIYATMPASARRMMVEYFHHLEPDAPLDRWLDEVRFHPVFRLRPA
ncbi:nitroreductase family deazaflavin-dependent oxidoreductase [Pseudonocardia sp. CA-107938]|uniref:nitroreductase family deazaflavin-dependent oxidoreductase n=1 Tax=Pseudonocardia sp. CA-107938 TaxID=3240021 RepID=UPI003D928F46